VAQDYEAEFAEMFIDDKFGPEPGRPTPRPDVSRDGITVQVLFSPDDGVEPVLVNLLDTAQQSVDFLAYSFTSNPLGQAMLRAHQAGIAIRGVMDADQAGTNVGGELPGFRSAGLDVRLDGNPGQMHEKVIIIDEQVVVVGSYNFSRNASESNDENVLLIHSPVIARVFMQEFERLYAVAAP